MSKQFAKARAVSLIEVMVSQVIALVLIVSLTSLVVALSKKLHSETAVSDAQVQLRQASHLLLRDTQGIGGDFSAVGDLVVVDDGGTNAPDSFTIFKRDESVCNGGVVVSQVGSSVNLQSPSPCPFSAASTPLCSEADLAGRTLLVKGTERSIIAAGAHNFPGDCKINFANGQQQDEDVAAYNTRYGESVNGYNGAFSNLGAAEVLAGTAFTYRLNGNDLQRKLNDGPFETIVGGIFDLQAERIFDIDGDGVIDPGETVSDDPTAPLPTGARADNFLGLRIGLIAFARAPDGMAVNPPTNFGNRVHSTFTGGRRYRASFVLAAARNRNAN